jgi:hypothetical protein
VFFWALGCSSWFLNVLGVEVDDAQDGSWRLLALIRHRIHAPTYRVNV